MTDTCDKRNKPSGSAESNMLDADHSTVIRPDQLAEMLGVALEADKADREDTIELTARALQLKLDGPLPPDPAAAARLPSLLDNIYKELVPGGRRSLGEALVDPKTDLSTILRIKDHAKQSASEKLPPARHTVAITIYYAAIASAMLFHDRKITTYSHETLAEGIGKLLGNPWMPEPMIEHLKNARKACLDQMDQTA